MLLSTPGLVLHATPYAETSVVAKVFTRQLGLRSYIIKSVRGPRGRVKQNLLQPLSSIDMVVYDNPKTDLNHIKELSPRHPDSLSSDALSPVFLSIRFFMTEVLYKALREAEPMPELFDYVEAILIQHSSLNTPHSTLPIVFLLTVAHHLGIEPLDNYCSREPLFDLQEGRFVSISSETTLSPNLSLALHQFLSPQTSHLSPLNERRSLIDALIAYYQLHLSGFHYFHSHEILHTILK